MKSDARGLKITKIISRNYNCIAYIMKPTSEKNAVLVWSHVHESIVVSTYSTANCINYIVRKFRSKVFQPWTSFSNHSRVWQRKICQNGGNISGRRLWNKRKFPKQYLLRPVWCSWYFFNRFRNSEEQRTDAIYSIPFTGAHMPNNSKITTTNRRYHLTPTYSSSERRVANYWEYKRTSFAAISSPLMRALNSTFIRGEALDRAF